MLLFQECKLPEEVLSVNDFCFFSPLAFTYQLVRKQLKASGGRPKVLIFSSSGVRQRLCQAWLNPRERGRVASYVYAHPHSESSNSSSPSEPEEDLRADRGAVGVIPLVREGVFYLVRANMHQNGWTKGSRKLG